MVRRTALLLPVLSCLLAASLAAQSKTMLIDCGSPSFQTFGGGGFWNNVVSGLVGTHALVDTAGAPSGLVLTFDAALKFTQSTTDGVVTPTPGSPLAQTGWPASVTRDALHGDEGKPDVELTLSGLDTGATYDLTFLASQLGGLSLRTTHVEVFGVQTPEAILDASDNASEVVLVPGLRPNGAGELRLTLAADRTNDAEDGFFCLNALRIEEYAPGTQPPLVAFGFNRFDVSRREGAGPYGAFLDTYTNNGTLPSLTLSAVDDATGLAPTWLTVPAATIGSLPFQLTVDEGVLALGAATATVTAQAAGYADATLRCALEVRPADGYRNLLFYGNSYTLRNGTVGALVEDLVVEAGFERPQVVQRLEGGKDLFYHKTNPGHVAAITQELPFGEEWDFVVMQGQSTEATATLGDPAGFAVDAVGIVANVRFHSPGARACLFQTWARGQGHSFYPGTFSGPSAMHAQVEQAYRQAALDIDAAYGDGTARRAAVGEAVALQNFDAALYEPDLSHPRPALTVQTAMAVVTATYGTTACAVVPDFAAPSDLADTLQGFGIDAGGWTAHAGYADRAAAPEDREYPGSGEDLLLRTAVDGTVTACPRKPAAAGQLFSAVLSSPAGGYAGSPASYYLDLWATGAPPGAWGLFPEVQLAPVSAFAVGTTPALAGAGLSLVLPVSSSVVGLSVGVQGVAFAPSTETGNLLFTTTDAHELVLN
ncbi:MAG: hypothetical protein AAF682_24455 [Planctomycetota bacterium]